MEGLHFPAQPLAHSLLVVRAPGDFVEGNPWKPNVESDEEEPVAAGAAVNVNNAAGDKAEKPIPS